MKGKLFQLSRVIISNEPPITSHKTGILINLELRRDILVKCSSDNHVVDAGQTLRTATSPNTPILVKLNSIFEALTVHTVEATICDALREVFVERNASRHALRVHHLCGSDAQRTRVLRLVHVDRDNLQKYVCFNIIAIYVTKFNAIFLISS